MIGKFIDRNSNLILLLYCFFISIQKYTGMRNVMTVLSVIVILFHYKRRIVDVFKRIPLSIASAYIIFLGSLVIASIAVGDSKSIDKAFSMLCYAVPFLILYIFPKNDKSSMYILLGFSMGVLWMSSYEIYDYIRSNVIRAEGLYGHPNFMASILVINLPITISLLILNRTMYECKKCIIFLGGLASCLGLIGLYLTASRGGILGFALGFIICCTVYFAKRRSFRKSLSLIVGVIFITSALIGALYLINGSKFSRSYDNERLLLIESSYNMWKDHKLYGVGLDNWKENYNARYILPQAKEPELGIPHNVLAYYYSTTGLIGGIGYCLFLAMISYYLIMKLGNKGEVSIYAFAALWSFLSITIHGFVDIGITKQTFFRCLCAVLGVCVSMIEMNKMNR